MSLLSVCVFVCVCVWCAHTGAIAHDVCTSCCKRGRGSWVCTFVYIIYTGRVCEARSFSLSWPDLQDLGPHTLEIIAEIHIGAQHVQQILCAISDIRSSPNKLVWVRNDCHQCTRACAMIPLLFYCLQFLLLCAIMGPGLVCCWD